MELCTCRGGGACGFLITGLKKSLHCETLQAIVKTIQCKRTSLSSCSHIESGSLCGGLGDHRGPVRKRTYGKGDGAASATLKAGASANDADTLSPFVWQRVQPDELERIKKHYETSAEDDVKLLDKPEQSVSEF